MTLVYNKFNRGEIDDLLLAREDVKRINDSASLMNNFIPSRMGPMVYRPGMEYLGEIGTSNVHLVPFFASRDSISILEFTNNQLRIWDKGSVIRTSATTDSVTNGGFDTNLSGWINASDTGASATWDSGSALLSGDGTNEAKLYQTITTDIGAEHTLRVVILEANVTVRIGTSGVDSDDIFTGDLAPGVHSLVFTPNSNVTITLVSSLEYDARVDSVQYQGTGDLTLPTVITTSQLHSIRYTQSADVVFIAYNNGQQYRIERRGVKSWSIVNYRSFDGPFGFINNSDVTLRVTNLSGNGNLVANKDYFTQQSVGTLYKLLSSGQKVTETVTAEASGTNSIRVTGVTSDRDIRVTATFNPATATVTLQRSTDEVTWTDVESYTNDTFKTYNDELDNSILFYRLYVKAGEYTSGTLLLTLTYDGGSIEGIARVTSYTSPTTVRIQTYQDFGSNEATRDWYEGQWSESEGYPTSVALYEGRLWWAGKTRLWGSVSDSFASFDDSLEGSDAPVQRTIGFGPVDTIDWLAISSRLLMGLASDELAVRSSSFGELLNATNTNIKSGSSQGVAPIDPVRIDDDIMFVQRAGRKLFRLAYNSNRDAHGALDLMTLNESIGNPGIKRIAVTRQPETRIYCVLNDGTGIVFTYDIAEDVQAWSRIDTNGSLIDIVVIPGDDEDRVYFAVQRDNGVYMERLAMFQDITRYPHDSYVSYSSPGLTLTGLNHLEGEQVSVWADFKRVGLYTVSGGQITLNALYSNVVVGLPYDADYISNKISGYANYSSLTRRERVNAVGMIARDICRDGFLIGPDADSLQKLPSQENGKAVTYNQLLDEYDEPKFPFGSRFNVNSKVHIKASAPCRIMALVYDIEESKKLGQNP